MSTSRINEETKSNIVKVIPPATNDMALKTINGIIEYLKKFRILNYSELNYPPEGISYLDYYQNNPVVSLKDDEVENKINSLNYLYAPITVEEVRTEINKIIEIFKISSIITTEIDFEEMIDSFTDNFIDLDFNSIDYGVASDVYLNEDIIEYGKAATDNHEQF